MGLDARPVVVHPTLGAGVLQHPGETRLPGEVDTIAKGNSGQAANPIDGHKHVVVFWRFRTVVAKRLKCGVSRATKDSQIERGEITWFIESDGTRRIDGDMH